MQSAISRSSLKVVTIAEIFSRGSCLDRLRHGAAGLAWGAAGREFYYAAPLRPGASTGAAKASSAGEGDLPEHRLAQPAVAAHAHLEQDRHQHACRMKHDQAPTSPQRGAANISAGTNSSQALATFTTML